jgi:hypothetical protein
MRLLDFGMMRHEAIDDSSMYWSAGNRRVPSTHWKTSISWSGETPGAIFQKPVDFGELLEWLTTGPIA